jgi:hypothetical protein
MSTQRQKAFHSDFRACLQESFQCKREVGIESSVQYVIVTMCNVLTPSKSSKILQLAPTLGA